MSVNRHCLKSDNSLNSIDLQDFIGFINKNRQIIDGLIFCVKVKAFILDVFKVGMVFAYSTSVKK